MNSLQTASLIMTAIAGGFAAWLLRNITKSQFLNVLLSFSGAYLLGVVVLHLLPEVFASAEDFQPALYILAGFFIQLIIVQFTRGVEHGHLHLHEHFSKNYVFGVIFGLSLHALMEGVPLADGAITEQQMHPLYYGILVHKFPETFALATVLFFSYKKIFFPIFFLFLFSMMTPIGTFAGDFLLQHSMIENVSRLVAIVCGALIHISTTIIFEASGKAHHIGLYKFLAIIAGAAISLLTISM